MKLKQLFKLTTVATGCFLAMNSFAGGPDHMYRHHHHPHERFNGLFVGPNFGIQLSQINTIHTNNAVIVPSPDLDDLNAFVAYGFDVGYGHQWDHFYGALDFIYSRFIGEYVTDETILNGFSYDTRKSLNNHYNFNMQLGYVFRPDMMAYIAPGFSGVDMRSYLKGTVGSTEPPVQLKKMAYGPSLGFGMKFLLTPHFILGMHGMYEYFQSKKTAVTPNTLSMKVKHYTQLNINFNYLVDL